MTTPALDKTQETEAQPAELYQLLQQLTAPQLAQVQTFAEFLLHQQQKQTLSATTASPRRTPGLGRGTIWVSDDFDDPLPDNFWFSPTDPLEIEARATEADS